MSFQIVKEEILNLFAKKVQPYFRNNHIYSFGEIVQLNVYISRIKETNEFGLLYDLVNDALMIIKNREEFNKDLNSIKQKYASVSQISTSSIATGTKMLRRHTVSTPQNVTCTSFASSSSSAIQSPEEDDDFDEARRQMILFNCESWSNNSLSHSSIASQHSRTLTFKANESHEPVLNGNRRLSPDHNPRRNRANSSQYNDLKAKWTSMIQNEQSLQAHSEQEQEESSASFWLQAAGIFAGLGGIALIVVAFTALNFLSFGTVAIATLSIGVACTLTGIGLFAFGINNNSKQDEGEINLEHPIGL